MKSNLKKRAHFIKSLEFLMKGDFFADVFHEFFPDVVKATIPYPFSIIILTCYIASKFLKFCANKSNREDTSTLKLSI